MGTTIKRRLLITTYSNQYKNHFIGFSAIEQPLDWEVCRFLLAFYLGCFEKDDLQEAIREFTLVDPDTGDPYDISIDDGCLFYDDPVFIEQIVKNEEKYGRLQQNMMSLPFINQKLLQNSDGTVWVVPLLKERYQNDNVDYVECLINWAGKDVDELYLLLHDKDLYQIDKPHHQVNKEDPDLSAYSSDKVLLMKHIEKSRVFVFVHASASDDYCKSIVHNPDLSHLSFDSILTILYDGEKMAKRNCELTKQLGKCMCKKEIEEKLKSASGPYDFSISFLEE